MAQLQIILNHDEIHQLLAADDKNGAFLYILQSVLNEFLKKEIEIQQQRKASLDETGATVVPQRNGYYQRSLKTAIGTLQFKVPRFRDGEMKFETVLFEHFSTADAAFLSGLAELVVKGLSTRKVSDFVKAMFGSLISKSAVSNACKSLMAIVEAFKSRPLDRCYSFLLVDATYFPVRENGRRKSVAFLIAHGITNEGRSEILGFTVAPNESTETWSAFFRDLKRRGVGAPWMLTSDAHEGIQKATRAVFPQTAWQRCQFHFSRNLVTKVRKNDQTALADALRQMFTSKTMEEAVERRDAILATYSDDASEAMRKALDEGFESAMTVMALPDGNIRKALRTSNTCERDNRELKRRSRVINVFVSEDSVVRIMGAVLMHLHDRRMAGRALFSAARYQEMIDAGIPDALAKHAAEQQKLARI